MRLPRPHPAARPHVLFYSHDSVGLGHLRRTISLANAVRRQVPRAAILVATGSSRPTTFEPGRGIELVKLPSITKDDEGRYVSRDLPVALSQALAIRRAMLLSVFESFAPDVLVVDHKVRGLADELDLVLVRARERGTRTILGLRDVLDAPEVVAREWGGDQERSALAGYDRVLVYGSPEVFDPRVEYPIPPELGERLEFVGYVTRRPAVRSFDPLPRLEDSVLVTVGGGDDGAPLIETYLESLALERRSWASTLVLGPLFDAREARRIKRRARGLGDVTVHRFYEDLPRLLASSSAVVAMAGYNTAVEIVASGRPAILVPRCFPRREQVIRAERLARLGLVTCLTRPSAADLGRALAGLLERRPPRPHLLPSLEGSQGLAAIVLQELQARPGALARAAAAPERQESAP